MGRPRPKASPSALVGPEQILCRRRGSRRRLSQQFGSARGHIVFGGPAFPLWRVGAAPPSSCRRRLPRSQLRPFNALDGFFDGRHPDLGRLDLVVVAVGPTLTEGADAEEGAEQNERDRRRLLPVPPGREPVRDLSNSGGRDISQTSDKATTQAQVENARAQGRTSRTARCSGPCGGGPPGGRECRGKPCGCSARPASRAGRASPP